MGLGLELVAGQATAPSTTFTALTMNAGNTATIRSARMDARVLLLSAWADVQGAGQFRIRSPRLHDNLQGIRLDTVVSDVKPLLPLPFRQPLIPQDPLTLELTGSATGGDIESAALLIWYEDLFGVEAKLLTHMAVLERMVHLVTSENTISTGTAGGYSGEEAINAEIDTLKANTDYALLGYLADAECLAVRWRGTDTGNLGVGGPGDDAGRDYTRDWFQRLSRAFDLPLIPSFNAANKDNVLVDAHQDENGTDVTVTTILAELAPTPLRTLGR